MKTHFGFKNVDVDQKQSMVNQVFDSVANKYDLMNDVMSFGIHRFWKKIAASRCAVLPKQKVLDLASGSCDIVALNAKYVQEEGLIVASDINSNMLFNGREKLINQGIIKNIEFCILNAESIPFADNTFDCVSISFGLRNVTDREKALKEIYRVLKPHGRIVILEFSHTENPALKKIYDTYSMHVIPKIGKLITQDQDSYQYLVESIRKFPNQKALQQELETIGFENCSYQSLTFGIVAVHIGFKNS